MQEIELTDLRKLAHVVKEKYNYDFNNYAQRFRETSDYFTPGAWSAFADSIASANIIDNTITQRIICIYGGKVERACLSCYVYIIL